MATIYLLLSLRRCPRSWLLLVRMLSPRSVPYAGVCPRSIPFCRILSESFLEYTFRLTYYSVTSECLMCCENCSLSAVLIQWWCVIWGGSCVAALRNGVPKRLYIIFYVVVLHLILWGRKKAVSSRLPCLPGMTSSSFLCHRSSIISYYCSFDFSLFSCYFPFTSFSFFSSSSTVPTPTLCLILLSRTKLNRRIYLISYPRQEFRDNFQCCVVEWILVSSFPASFGGRDGLAWGVFCCAVPALMLVS